MLNPLSARPVADAIESIMVVAETIIGALYTVELCVGFVPSVV